ncbi:MAG: hypothetical protein ACJ8GK_00340 [Luteimonas sp.]
MTVFEFVFSLISVITSLALTRLLSGFADLYRHTERVRWSWRHAFWTSTAFMLLIGNWAAFWRQHATTGWGGLDILLQLVFLGVLYVFCDLVMPDMPAGDEILDLRVFHERQGKRYVVAQTLFAALAMLLIAREATGFWQWLDWARYPTIGVLLGMIALRARSVWLDSAAATGVAILASVYMMGRLHLLAS